MPLVSVILPTHNRREALSRALASVAAQTLQDFETIVVDDASSDGTAEWLRHTHPILTLLSLPRPCGAAAARNRGLALATSPIVAFLDDDDLWRPAYLQTQVAQLLSHPRAALSTTAHIQVDAAGHITRPDLRPLFSYPSPLAHISAECPIHTMSVVTCHRSLFESFSPLDESLSIAHDLDFYLRLAAAGVPMLHSPAELVVHAVPGGLVTRHRLWHAEDSHVLSRHFAAAHLPPPHQRLVRASRSLFFARVALAKGDLTFACARLAEASLSPVLSSRIVSRRLLRRATALPNPSEAPL